MDDYKEWREYLLCLENEYVCLSEVRGQLSPEDNARVEEQLAIIARQIQEAKEVA